MIGLFLRLLRSAADTALHSLQDGHSSVFLSVLVDVTCWDPRHRLIIMPRVLAVRVFLCLPALPADPMAPGSPPAQLHPPRVEP